MLLSIDCKHLILDIHPQTLSIANEMLPAEKSMKMIYGRPEGLTSNKICDCPHVNPNAFL